MPHDAGVPTDEFDENDPDTWHTVEPGIRGPRRDDGPLARQVPLAAERVDEAGRTVATEPMQFDPGPDGPDGPLPELPPADATIEQLEDVKAAIERRMDALDEKASSIKGQLDEAKNELIAMGKYADQDWWRRANSALRYKGRQRQRCQRLLGEVNRRIRAAKTHADNQSLLRQFVCAAKAALPEALYIDIWKVARQAAAAGAPLDAEAEAEAANKEVKS